MSLFNRVDNSKLTPEFHQGNGQGEQAADNGQGEITQNGNATPMNEGQVAQPQPQQQQPQQQDVDGIQVDDEVFESQEDLLNAYRNMKNEMATREKSYKELQGAYTKSRQEIAMRNKIATPNRNRQVAPIMPQPMPNMPNMFNQGNPYNNPINQPYAYGNRQNNFVAGYNNGYNPYMAQQQQMQQPIVNEAMINMAAEAKITELKNADPDFDEVAGELWDIMENDDYFANIKFTDPDMAKNAIGAAYQMAKQKVETAKANIKINNARVEAYTNKQQKMLNNDQSNVAKTNKGQQQKSDADKIRESIVGAKPLKF